MYIGGICMTRTFAFVVMVILSLIGALLLEQTLSEHMLLEVLVIIGLMCLAMLAVFGIWLEQRWGWAVGIIFFAGSIANAVLVFLTAQEGFLPFMIVVAWNTVGIMLCSLRSSKTAYEAYDEAVQLENIMPVSKRKTSRQKSRRKTDKKAKRRSK